MKCIFDLEDGTVFEGEAHRRGPRYGLRGRVQHGMAGYLEVLTDPSYAGQGVTMTYPLMGNYGINEEDAESRQPWASAFIVQQVARRASNYRSRERLTPILRATTSPASPGWTPAP